MTTEAEWRAYCFEGEVERFDVNLLFACMGEMDRRWKAADRQPGFPPSEAWWEDVRALYIETVTYSPHSSGGASEATHVVTDHVNASAVRPTAL